jgi:hypothetical protein
MGCRIRILSRSLRRKQSYSIWQFTTSHVGLLFIYMATNIINYTYKVLSNPSLRFCTHHHMNSFVRVVCVINLQHIFVILWRSWAFSLALDSTTHQSTSYFDLHLTCIFVYKWKNIIPSPIYMDVHCQCSSGIRVKSCLKCFLTF